MYTISANKIFARFFARSKTNFYAGVHFKVDNEAGLKMGKELGKWVAEAWMRESKTARK
jgi:hypothetical protein